MWMTENFTVAVKDATVYVEHPEGEFRLYPENDMWVLEEDGRVSGRDTLPAQLYHLRTKLTSSLLKQGVLSVGHIQELIEEVHEVITIIFRMKLIKRSKK